MNDNNVKIIASEKSWIEQEAIDQLHQTAKLKGIERAVGLPDLHAGRGIPIGAAFWSKNIIYPHLVGNDIGCGMALWQTDLPLAKFKIDKSVKKLQGLEEAWDGNQSARLQACGLPDSLSGEALGTIGGGNHFAEFQRIEKVLNPTIFEQMELNEKQLLLLVHSGSRGLGHAILESHILEFGSLGLNTGSETFQKYINKHDQAMIWAKLNRDIIAERFLHRIGTQASCKLDIFHNSVTPHEDGWLHRKGAAPADKGCVVIPGSRGSMTYLVKPKVDHADMTLYSLAHGAGRKWPRSSAKAKLGKRINISELERTDLGGRVICEDKNLIFEEAPQAYKNIESVIDDLSNADLIEVVAVLRPLITYKTRRQ